MSQISPANAASSGLFTPVAKQTVAANHTPAGITPKLK